MSAILAVCGTAFCAMVSDGRMVEEPITDGKIKVLTDALPKVRKLNRNVLVGFAGDAVAAAQIINKLDEYDVQYMTLEKAVKVLQQAAQQTPCAPVGVRLLVGGRGRKGDFQLVMLASTEDYAPQTQPARDGAYLIEGACSHTEVAPYLEQYVKPEAARWQRYCQNTGWLHCQIGRSGSDGEYQIFSRTCNVINGIATADDPAPFKDTINRRNQAMKIALINENSQAAKNALIEATLRKVVEPMGHEVVNYGMYAADDAAQLTYVQNGILAAVLLNSGAADYVITGCGTGEGAMLALNSFPGVICGHVEDPVDAYTFAHVNDGNAVALPFAKGFGWGGELNLEYVFEKLFGFGHGQGYPKERVVPEQRNKKILDGVRSVAFRDLCDILKDLDHDLVKGAFAGEHFAEHFFADCKDEKIAATVKELMA